MLLRLSQLIGFGGVSMLVISIFIQFVFVPQIVNFLLKRKLSLNNGWPMRDIWSKLPFVIENHVYVFNITNPGEIDNGAKPIIEEVGPFVYDMYQEKVEQIDYEEDDTLSYILENTYHYNRIKSKGLSDELEIYFPNLFIMTVANGPLKDNPSYVSFTSKAVDVILNKPTSVFDKVNVRTVLFDGLPIPCGGVEDYFAKLICNEIQDKYAAFLKKKGDTYLASLFGFRNGTSQKNKRVRIRRGKENIKDLGKVVEIDGMNNLSIWKDNKCNAYGGTDGTIFPPLMSKKNKNDIPLVYPLICRRLALTFDSNVKFAGLNLLRYTGDLGTDGDHVPEEKCYCITADHCLKKGMFELYRCLNVPMIVSNPHFYMADPFYLTRLNSLNPSKEKHLTYVDFDPLTGSPVRAHVRAQYNMELLKIDKFRSMRNYSYAMLPLIWTDEVLVLPDFFLRKIKIGYFLLGLKKFFVYLLSVCGLVFCIVAMYLEYRSRKSIKPDLKPSSSPPTENGTAGSAGPKNFKVNIARLISAIRPAPPPQDID